MTLGARRQSTSNYCSVTLLTQRVNSLHIELKLIKTVYSASIPLTSLLKTRNSSSSFRGLINALDQEQYHTLTFRDFQSVKEKREMEPGRHSGLLGRSPHGLLTCPGRWGFSVWHGQRSPRREHGTALARGTAGTGKMVKPFAKRLGAHRIMSAGVKQPSEGTMSRCYYGTRSPGHLGWVLRVHQQETQQSGYPLSPKKKKPKSQTRHL